MSSLPVLDIQPFPTEPSGPQAAEFVDRLRQTLHDPGFCDLIGYGVKFRVRSHPDVAEIHHPDLVGRFG